VVNTCVVRLSVEVSSGSVVLLSWRVVLKAGTGLKVVSLTVVSASVESLSCNVDSLCSNVVSLSVVCGCCCSVVCLCCDVVRATCCVTTSVVGVSVTTLVSLGTLDTVTFTSSSSTFSVGGVTLVLGLRNLSLSEPDPLSLVEKADSAFFRILARSTEGRNLGLGDSLTATETLSSDTTLVTSLSTKSSSFSLLDFTLFLASARNLNLARSLGDSFFVLRFFPHLLHLNLIVFLLLPSWNLSPES